MQIHFLTTLPELVQQPLSQSILGRAAQNQKIEFFVHNLRQWATDAHHSTDDHPYGGGPGMVMLIEPIARALDSLNFHKGTANESILLTSAKGELYTQQTAQKFSTLHRILIICGHYEGVDERVAEHLVDQEVRIGNYVLTGGELAALVIADSVTRLLPGVLGSAESLAQESHSTPGYIEYPQYTRPQTFQGWTVPEVLLSGNHTNITAWKTQHEKSLDLEK